MFIKTVQFGDIGEKEKKIGSFEGRRRKRLDDRVTCGFSVGCEEASHEQVLIGSRSASS